MNILKKLFKSLKLKEDKFKNEDKGTKVSGSGRTSDPLPTPVPTDPTLKDK